MIEQRIRARIGAYSVPAVVHAVQGDTGRVFVFELEDYTVTGEEGASLNCERPDGTFFTYAGTVNASTNLVTVPLDVEGGALSQDGTVTFQLELIKDDKIACTFKGLILVEPVVGGEATQDERDFRDAIQAQLNAKVSNTELQEAVSDLEDEITDTASGLQAQINAKANASDVALKANKATTINGKSLEADRVIYAQDIPSKNLLQNTAKTTTTNGITFTVNDDGSVTANGTASADAYLLIHTFSASEASALNGMILNGCPSTGGENKFFIILQQLGSPYNTYGWDTGNGSVISGANDQARALVYIKSGQTLSNIVFRPMIRLASIEDDSYVPYSKTAVELSKDLYGPLIRRTIVNFGNVTIGSSGYTSLDASLVPSPPDGYVSAFALIQNYSSATPQVAFGINSTGTFAFGSQMTITALRIAYFFIRKSAFGES